MGVDLLGRSRDGPGCADHDLDLPELGRDDDPPGGPGGDRPVQRGAVVEVAVHDQAGGLGARAANLVGPADLHRLDPVFGGRYGVPVGRLGGVGGEGRPDDDPRHLGWRGHDHRGAGPFGEVGEVVGAEDARLGGRADEDERQEREHGRTPSGFGGH